MPEPDLPDRPGLFGRTLRECRQLYVSSGELCERSYPHLLDRNGGEFIKLMDDLHRALVLKVYINVCEADRVWSKNERLLAEILCHHLWGEWLSGDRLNQAMKHASAESKKLRWYSLVRPFDRIEPLRERASQLITLVSRLANLVARADGTLGEAEARLIKHIQAELDSHLNRRALDEVDTPTHEEQDRTGAEAVERIQHEAGGLDVGTPRVTQKPRSAAPRPTSLPTTREEAAGPTLEEALSELDELIGLASVKQEVRTLANFLKLQQRRAEAGLPTTDVSLHMVFTGNPGTGKTTVARIVGKVYRALGVLEKGHLIETDRSGLVAEYAGQTGPKTNKKIDEALDGILFIDEAYSLVASTGDDPYGREAVQALLKRAEDDRRRLVVILAGYPDELRTLLKSNPGLSSRFNRTLEFADYQPIELVRIFGHLCQKNHYRLTPAVRLRAIQGFTALFGGRDRHFGNGRTVRNVFEQSIRAMANRLATLKEISADELQQLEAGDIIFRGLGNEAFHQSHVLVACPKCQHSKDIPGHYLGRKVTCPKCKSRVVLEWGELVTAP